MPATKFQRDAHPAEEKLHNLAREMREIMEALRARGGQHSIPPHKAGELAAKARRALMESGQWP